MPPALCPYSPFPSPESLDLAEPTRMIMIFICFYVSPSRCAKCRACTCKVRGKNENTPVHARGQAGPSEPHPLRTPPPVCHAPPFSSTPTRDLLLSSPWPSLCFPVRFGVPGSLCRAQKLTTRKPWLSSLLNQPCSSPPSASLLRPSPRSTGVKPRRPLSRPSRRVPSPTLGTRRRARHPARP